jgi:tetratricopeptide (TPR) repeat protein
MKSLYLPLTLILLGLSTSVAAQHGGGGSGSGSGGGTGGGRGGGTGTVGNTPTTGFPNSTLPPVNPSDLMFFLSGKVVVDDGSALTEAAALQTDCKGQRHTVGHTDTKGQFSFQIGGGSQNHTSELPDPTDTGSNQTPAGQRSAIPDWHGCQLEAIAPGFTSRQVELGSLLSGDSYVNVGNVVLHRMAQTQGFFLSATSAAAPPKAKKNFDKGVSLEKKNKWAAAQQRFQSAVDLYPKFAVAWVALGRMQLKQDRENEARESFQKAIAADSRFLPPYQELIAISAKQGRWQELGDNTDQALRLDPVSFPQYWFMNSAAYYNQHKYDVALKSAMRGIETDVGHRFPRLQYLLGLTLARKHDYPGAVEHIRNYLRVMPDAEDAEVAQMQLKRLEALATAPEVGHN